MNRIYYALWERSALVRFFEVCNVYAELHRTRKQRIAERDPFRKQKVYLGAQRLLRNIVLFDGLGRRIANNTNLKLYFPSKQHKTFSDEVREALLFTNSVQEDF